MTNYGRAVRQLAGADTNNVAKARLLDVLACGEQPRQQPATAIAEQFGWSAAVTADVLKVAEGLGWVTVDADLRNGRPVRVFTFTLPPVPVALDADQFDTPVLDKVHADSGGPAADL